MKFWVGDPCYHDGISKPHEKWIRLLDEAGYFQQKTNLIFEDRYVGGVGTLYGDGLYEDQLGNSYPVDAGIIGYVQHKEGDEEPFGMTLHYFSEYPEISVDSEGLIRIYGGSVELIIPTGDQDEEED